jgi:hypothetical protein
MTMLAGRSDEQIYREIGLDGRELADAAFPGPRTEVFFADERGGETTPAHAVRVEVVTEGTGGEPMILAFTLMPPSTPELKAA